MSIYSLSADQLTLEIAGGKGINLARLFKANFRVPPGFIIATDAYARFVIENQINSEIEAILREIIPDNLTDLERSSRLIRERFKMGTIPEESQAAIKQAYQTMGQPSVAVRSSATTEDLPGYSFAGQQDTFLNITSEGTLIEAVLNCWSSLWTARAIAYRARNGISHGEAALAVVVQQMIDSQTSGVLFTANPLSGRRLELIIEATYGLGEALVSGSVEPDRIVIEKATKKIISYELGAKAKVIEARPDGGILQREVDSSQNQRALSEEALGELINLGLKVEKFFGAPQDIEWAWDGRLQLLQSRPITSLYPQIPNVPASPLRVYVSVGSIQGIMDPFTPLGLESLKLLFLGGAKNFGTHRTLATQKAIQVAGQRGFVDLTGALRIPLGMRAIVGFLGIAEPSAADVIAQLHQQARLQTEPGTNFHLIRTILPFMLKFLIRFIPAMLAPRRSRIAVNRKVEQFLEKSRVRVEQSGSLSELVQIFQETMPDTFHLLLPAFIPRIGVGMGMLNLLKRLTRDLPDPGFDPMQLTRSSAHNVTIEMDLALWSAASQIRADKTAQGEIQAGDPEQLAGRFLLGQLSDTAQSAITNFLAQYGMRGLAEIDFGRPRWRENPAAILQMLQNYLPIDEEFAPDILFARGAVAAEESSKTLEALLKETRFGFLKVLIARAAAYRVRAMIGLRESPKFVIIRTMGLFRAAFLAHGAELKRAGVLLEDDDLFYLDIEQLESLAAGEPKDWKKLISERREAYTAELTRSQSPRLLLSDGEVFYEGASSDTEDDGKGLRGSPVSSGIVEGIVRVVHDPQTAELKSGEILVCRGTDPSWTPLFMLAGGLVMEVGGLMTHGSVVAREYGIPAVVGVHRATDKLVTGQRIQVDGSSGVVVVLEADNDAGAGN
jgi:rifampicin phosphotransferase